MLKRQAAQGKRAAGSNFCTSQHARDSGRTAFFHQSLDFSDRVVQLHLGLFVPEDLEHVFLAISNDAVW